VRFRDEFAGDLRKAGRMTEIAFRRMRLVLGFFPSG
jgi:hypothetical protein